MVMMAISPSRTSLWCRFSRGALGSLLLYAGIAKLWELGPFAEHIRDFGIVFDNLAKPLAASICVSEFVLGCGLLVNVRGALFAVVGLLCVFLAVLLYGIRLGLNIECGCLGVGYHVSLRFQALMDAGLLGWCYLVYRSCKSCESSRKT